MAELLVAGVVAAVFVGVNVGGSSTGVAFGPALGANVITRLGAGVLMSVSVLAGGWTVGRNVVTTVGHDIVAAPEFSLTASLVVLGCIGTALLVANVVGVPASTSMVAVCAMVGMGLASVGVHWAIVAEIAGWWLLSPACAFVIAAALGRWAYTEFAAWLGLEHANTTPVAIQWNRTIPRINVAKDGSRTERSSMILLLVIACYMGFFAGASNVANVVAPLVGSGTLSVNLALVIAVSTISVGAFTLARRTMATVGNDLTSLPLAAACLVATIGGTITTFLSYLGIPVSLALSTIAAIIGLGWGRTLRGRTRSPQSLPATRAETLTIR